MDRMSSTLFDLKGKVVLVTGATGGLGLAIVQAMSEHGAIVLVSDLDPVLCTKTAERIQRAGGSAHDLPADLSRLDSAATLANSALALYGRVDVLVCNAGMQGPAGPIGHTSSSDWQRVIDLNLRASVELTNALLPRMAMHPGSSVILMSSIAGLRGNKAIGLYGISKAALAQFARNLAVEWGPMGVRVNAISPGLIRTPLSASFIDNPAVIERRLSLTPLRRVGEPHEIAGVAVMLASAAGGFITGHNLVVDGGTTISDGN